MPYWLTAVAGRSRRAGPRRSRRTRTGPSTSCARTRRGSWTAPSRRGSNPPPRTPFPATVSAAASLRTRTRTIRSRRVSGTGGNRTRPATHGWRRATRPATRTDETVAHRPDQRHGRVTYRVPRGRLVLRSAHAPGDYRGGIMPGHGTVRIVEHDLAFARTADHSGLEVVAHQTGRGAAEPFIHRDMAPQPRVPAHVGSWFHERVPAERQHPDERVRLGRVAP